MVRVFSAILTLCFLGAAAHAVDRLSPDDAAKLNDRVAPSLVAVQYTIENELGRREVIGQGVVVGAEGVVLASIVLFPTELPDEQMKEFKIIVPGDEEKELDATFLGRDERSMLAFLKTNEKQSWPAVKFEDVPLKVGEPIYSIGLLPKDAGFKTFYNETVVSALLRGPVPQVLSTGGLSTVGSPVFNSQGKAVGFVGFLQRGQFFLLDSSGNFLDNMHQQPRFFIPSRDFLSSLSDMPTGEPLKLVWLGAGFTPVEKSVAEHFGLADHPVVNVGEIIPGSPAEKAGLKRSDKIVKADGQYLERGDEPQETGLILTRKLRWKKVGDKVTLSVMREKDKPAEDVVVTLEEQPKQPNTAKRHYVEDLGVAAREIVFADTYAKRVSPETKGVVVALVRPDSPSASARLFPGDIITEVNKVPVKDLDSFKTQIKTFRTEHPKDPVVLVVLRARGTEVIKIEPPQ